MAVIYRFVFASIFPIPYTHRLLLCKGAGARVYCARYAKVWHFYLFAYSNLRRIVQVSRRGNKSIVCFHFLPFQSTEVKTEIRGGIKAAYWKKVDSQ